MKKFLKIGFVAAAILFAAPQLHAQISIGISISANIAPPALPVYVQPPCPTDGYLWVPGYWAWDPDVNDYYWVPGVWVAPPQPGYLWTPAYWGYANGVYGFHPGYWGPHVGFYGGINYGGGYTGVGFVGGNWSGGHFRYNTAVVNVNTTVIHNTYIDRTVIVNNTVVNNRTSFNGPGGVQAQPRPQELAAMKEHHIQATGAQQSHEHTAMQDRGQFSKSNGGRPGNVTMNRVGGSHFNAQGAKAPHTAAPQRPVSTNANRPNTDQAHNNPAEARPQNQPRPNNVPRPSQQHVQHPMQQRPQQQQHTQPHNAPRPQAHPQQRPPEKEHR